MKTQHMHLDQVRQVAELARLHLDTAALQTMAVQLNGILDYMAELDVVDVSQVPPCAHAIAMSAPLRPDVVQVSLPRDEVLQQAPQTHAGAFAVPRILDLARAAADVPLGAPTTVAGQDQDKTSPANTL